MAQTETSLSSVADLGVVVPSELVDDFLAKLHYVSESLENFELHSTERNSVRFNLAPGHEHEVPKVAAGIAEVAQKMCAAYRPYEAKVLVSREGSGKYEKDPHPYLESTAELFRYGAGRYGLGPGLLALMNFFDRELQKLTERFSAVHHQFPSLIGADVLERCRYLRSFPHALTLVTHLREDLESVQSFARSAQWDNDHLNCDAAAVSPIQCLLSPTVCFHCFAWLENTVQPKPTAITALGKCFRYESGNLEGLERLWDFTMREVIFVGPQAYVAEQREKVIAESISLLDAWGLAYEIRSATDPFFIEDYATTTFQLAFDLKFEVRANLPYKKKSLAVGSFNLHQDFFGSSLNITSEPGRAAFTGCVGFGLERLVLAFIAQHGPDRSTWPEIVAQGVA